MGLRLESLLLVSSCDLKMRVSSLLLLLLVSHFTLS